MTQEKKYNLTYHDHPNTLSNRKGRNVNDRLKLLRKKVNFKNKTVLDLGCSGGLFSFLLSDEVKKIIGIDSDSELILRNKKIQRGLEIDNIDFKNYEITPEIFNEFEEKIDVILFLSVFHHMLSKSSVYKSNQKKEKFDYHLLFEKLALKTELLVFEVGRPDEGYLWCSDLPKFSGNWSEWVMEEFLMPNFNNIKIYNVSPKRIPFTHYLMRKTRRNYKKDGFIRKKIKSSVGYDAREYRELYFCSNIK